MHPVVTAEAIFCDRYRPSSGQLPVSTLLYVANGNGSTSLLCIRHVDPINSIDSSIQVRLRTTVYPKR